MIKTNRCTLNKLSEADKFDIRLLYQNENVRKYLGGIVNNEIFLNSFEKMCLTNLNYYWVIRLTENNQFVGLISLDKYHDNVNIEVSYQILPKWWGRGLATETLNAVLHYAFINLNIKSIYAETQTANKASCKMLHKAGFRLHKKLKRFNENQSVFIIER